MFVSRSAMKNQGETPPAENQARPLGNSERIRQRFGGYGIEVLESGTDIRVSSLYSIDDGLRTNRTFAVVAYPAEIEPVFQKEHDEIMNGQSIGIVFEKNGWVIDKRHQYFGKMQASSDYSRVFSISDGMNASQPAIHVYSLFVKKNDAEYQYASIAEVHHPEYLKLADLDAIYGAEFDGKNQDVSDFLKIVDAKMQGFISACKD